MLVSVNSPKIGSTLGERQVSSYPWDGTIVPSEPDFTWSGQMVPTYGGQIVICSPSYTPPSVIRPVTHRVTLLPSEQRVKSSPHVPVLVGDRKKLILRYIEV